MLLSGESYRNILAVTFTNAATAEMKERILSYLLRIAHGEEDDFLHVVRTFMLRDNDVPDAILCSRASECLHAILQDYDNFSVTTIDSFLQQLIRGLAQAIGRTADFSISTDADQVITKAVDTMLSSELTEDSKRTVYDYIARRLGDGKSWDIRAGLIRIAGQLYRESVQVHSTRLGTAEPLVLDEQKIDAYSKALYARYNAELKQFTAMVQQAKSDYDAKVPYTTGRDAGNAISNMVDSVTKLADMSKDYIFRGATANGLATMQADPRLRALQDACDRMRRTYWEVTCSQTYLHDMRLMHALEQSIRHSLMSTNTALLADTAVTLAEALRPGDADFILEKAGIRYRHIMMDEFQDTSQLQWRVFTHLIQEVLAVPGQTVLIVGDTKQSIYRFRNGDWQIMEAIGRTELQEAYNPSVAPLVRNQRSREAVVRFNLGVMEQVARQDNLQFAVSQADKRPVGQALYDEQQAHQPLSSYYRTDKHAGGYVRCRFYPYYSKSKAAKTGRNELLKEPQQRALWEDACLTIEQLIAAGERPKDILVLARFNSELRDWATYCRDQGERFPLLNSTQMASRDSFRLEASCTVLLLVEALRYLQTGSQTALAFLRLHRDEATIDRLHSIEPATPLYDRLQQQLQILCCHNGIYTGEDTAYVNSFLDQVQSFIASNGSDVQALLQYWDDKLSSSAVSSDSSTEAIQLMSVHTAKGLEGKSVVILNASWLTENDHRDSILWSEAVRLSDDSLPYIPLPQGKDLQRTGEGTPYYRSYRREHEAQVVDNYNLLYVALTRAADNLYVYALTEAGKPTVPYSTVAASLLDYTGLAQDMTTFDGTNGLYLEYADGSVHIHQPEEERSAVFGFAGATQLSTSLYSDSGQVRFRQSQESTQYTLETEDAPSSNAQTDFGLLCHDIFAHIERAQDAPQVLELYRQQGLIDSDEQYDRIAALVRQAFTDEQIKQWFDGSWPLMREWAILQPHATIRPDRVMIKGDTAIVLDYKFTDQPRRGYIQQVRDYMSALRDMHYTRVEGWLWYAFTNQLVRVNE